MLDKYYRCLDETPVYYTAVALHSKYRFKYFEEWRSQNQLWGQVSNGNCEELWKSKCKYRLLGDATIILSSCRPKKIYTPFDSYRTGTLSAVFQADKNEVPDDEFDRWQQDAGQFTIC